MSDRLIGDRKRLKGSRGPRDDRGAGTINRGLGPLRCSMFDPTCKPIQDVTRPFIIASLTTSKEGVHCVTPTRNALTRSLFAYLYPCSPLPFSKTPFSASKTVALAHSTMLTLIPLLACLGTSFALPNVTSTDYYTNLASSLQDAGLNSLLNALTVANSTETGQKLISALYSDGNFTIYAPVDSVRPGYSHID